MFDPTLFHSAVASTPLAAAGIALLYLLFGGGLGGGVPSSSHLLKAAKAAWTTVCCGPVLTGLVQPRTEMAAPTS